jgi:hypothetical protein
VGAGIGSNRLVDGARCGQNCGHRAVTTTAPPRRHACTGSLEQPTSPPPAATPIVSPATHITSRSTLSRPWIPLAWMATLRARPGVARSRGPITRPSRCDRPRVEQNTARAALVGVIKARVRPVSTQSSKTVRSGPPGLAGVTWLAVDFEREWQRLMRFPPIVVFVLPRARYGSWPIS